MEKGYVKAMVDVIDHTKSCRKSQRQEHETDVEVSLSKKSNCENDSMVMRQNDQVSSLTQTLSTNPFVAKCHIPKSSSSSIRDIFITRFDAVPEQFTSSSSDLSSNSDGKSQVSTDTQDSGIQVSYSPLSDKPSSDLTKRQSEICLFITRDGMLQSPAELFDDSWHDSEHTFESDFSEESDCDENERPNLHKSLSHEKKEDSEIKSGNKLYNIFHELLKTERAYVDRLRLVDQDFRATVVSQNETHNFLPADVVPRMFSNIGSIFQFHSNFLLPALEQRLNDWDTNPRIGDLMKSKGPFLKMYTEYVKNFDQAMTLINTWANKSSKFLGIMTDIQSKPECGHLSIQHHMLEPIQRVPRYELLLKDYLRNLPDDSSDQSDTKEALDLVMMAATHSNEAMRKLEGFRKLLEIHQSLGGSIDLISPTRELIKEGKITKISARREKTQERYILLFTDIVLICSEHLLGTYRVRARFDISGMQVYEENNRNFPHTFKIRSKQKNVELQASNAEDYEDWIKILQETISRYNKKKEDRGKLIQSHELGSAAPDWVKDEAVTMCMTCTAGFTAFRRRHHCRACGIVICAKCSSQRLALTFDESKVSRVCDKCFHLMKGSQPEEGDASKHHKNRLLQLKADTTGALLNNYILVSSDGGKSWSRRWTVIHETFVLYLFKAHQDVCALMSLPLPGYSVSEVNGESLAEKRQTLRLHHGNMSYKSVELHLSIDSSDVQRWLKVLLKVTKAELPEPDEIEDSQLMQSKRPESRQSSGSEISNDSVDENP